jgi:diguanylate cyclase (GGDEF)-like protein
MIRWGRVWGLLLACWSAGAALAGTPRFEPVGDAEILRDNIVTAVTLDSQGLIWAGSAAGLVRFDGQQFRLVPVAPLPGQSRSEQFVRTLVADPRGPLWAAIGNQGLARWDPATTSWTRWARTLNADATRAPASDSLRALALGHDGMLWVGSMGGGLDRFDPATGVFEHHRAAAGGLPDDRVLSLLVDSRGTLWIGTWKGVARLSGGRIERLDLGLQEQQITLLAEDDNGRLWVGSSAGGLARLTPQGELLDVVEPPGRSNSSGIYYAMAQLDDNELWIGGGAALERRRVADGSLIERLHVEGGAAPLAPRSEVRALLRDPSGMVWAGSYGGGLMRHLPPRPGLTVVRPDAAEWRRAGELDVRSVLQLRSGEVWLGTQAQGVAIYDSELQRQGGLQPAAEGAARGLPAGRVIAMAQTADDSVWVAVDRRLVRFDAQGRWLATLPPTPGILRRLYAAHDGSLWVGTVDGLWHLPPGAQALQPVAVPGGTQIEINAFVEAGDGSLWIGGSGGLFRRAAPSGDQVAVVESTGLASRSVQGLVLDSERRLWVDTSGGLHRLHGQQGNTAQFERVAAATAQESDGAFGANLLVDASGRLWTHRGYFDPRSGERRALGLGDGVDFGTGWFRSYGALTGGRLAFGGAQGLMVIDPARFKPWNYPPRLAMTELRVGGQERALPALGQPLVLAPGQRSLSATFVSLDFSQPARNRYRYRLTGLDSAWTETRADSRVASFTNLEPGHYQLEVQGTNRDGAWSPLWLRLPVEVQPLWWQTLPARLVAWVLGLALLWGAVRLRTHWLLKRQRRLEARVQERTSELQTVTEALRVKSVELEEASLTDPLTGLRNRRFVEHHLPSDAAQALRRYETAEQYGHSVKDPPMWAPGTGDLLFFLVDVDHFKRINDEYGHAAGDAVLVQMRGRLQQVFRAADYLVRWGGEEFLIVARGMPRHRAAELAERARQAVAAAPFVVDDFNHVALTCSVGFSAFPLSLKWPRALDWRQGLDLADAALYMAKHSGRDGWVGLTDADATSEDALRQDAQLTLDAWVETGRLSVQRSVARLP